MSEVEKVEQYLTEKGVATHEIQWASLLIEQAIATAKAVEGIPEPVIKRCRQVYSYMNEYYLKEGLDLSAPKLNQKLVQALQEYKQRIHNILEAEEARLRNE